MKNESNLLLRAFLVALLGLAVLFTEAQVVNEDDLRKIVLQGNETPLVSLECFPDGHTVWALGAKSDHILVVDTAGWAVVRTIPLTGFERGAEMTASADGRYVLLKAAPPISDPNKPKETHLAVLDAATGAVVLDVPNAMDGCLVPGADAVATLGGETVTVHPFHASPRSFNVPGAAYAIAIDPQAKHIAVAVHPDAPLLGLVPSMRSDKKALKAALKFKQVVAIHALEDGKRAAVVTEAYDLVHGLRFTADGRLLVYSVPDTRAGMATGGHVDQVDARTWQPLRASFMTWTVRPPLAIAPDGSTLALSSVEGRNKRKLTLYELATGDTRLMIDLEQKRRYDKAEGELHDARLGYAWLPDGRLLVAQGPTIGCYRP
jgi:hypothetical protein